MKVKVLNLPNSFEKFSEKYPYTVIREVGNDYWFYAMYADLLTASRTAAELRNGVVVESNNVER